jgi:1-deoxy-D-xylulose-5-phosphate reductoisomerase
MNGLSILGSTGTIGANTLALVDSFPDKYRVVSLAAGRNIDRLAEQIVRYRPRLVCTQEAAPELGRKFPGVEFVHGDEGLKLCVEHRDVTTVVVGIVGFAAMAPTLAAIRAQKRIALANKESLVVAGALLKQEASKSRSVIIPVDSEHNALYQLLEGRPRDHVETLVLTASGGPLLRRPELPLDQVTPEIAVAHPNWKMGPKISVDSATLMNKGLELIEACFLFEVPEEKIEVWVHPQSIVHGAIWLKDNTCLAQLSKPDMKSSIGHALAHPERLPRAVEKLKLSDMAKLEFFEPDLVRFPALKLAREALRSGGTHLVALNAANEIAVEAFLSRQISFSRIPALVADALAGTQSGAVTSLDQVYAEDARARRLASELVARHRN